jgi:hypothetical protein
MFELDKTGGRARQHFFNARKHFENWWKKHQPVGVWAGQLPAGFEIIGEQDHRVKDNADAQAAELVAELGFATQPPPQPPPQPKPQRPANRQRQPSQPQGGANATELLAAILAELKATRAEVEALRSELANVKANGQPQPDTGTFLADQLVADVLDGRAYWKVKGGQYRKHGIRVWPEVLEAFGVNLAELNPTEPFSLPPGTVATFVYNEDGTINKVIHFSVNPDA